jgi:hypothetical protein
MRSDLGDVLTLTTGRSLYRSRPGVLALAGFLTGSVMTAADVCMAFPALRETLIAAHPALPDEAAYLHYIATSGCDVVDGWSLWVEKLGDVFDVSDAIKGSVTYSAQDRAYRPNWYDPTEVIVPASIAAILPALAPASQEASETPLPSPDDGEALVFSYARACNIEDADLSHFAPKVKAPQWDLMVANYLPACDQCPGSEACSV